MRRIGIIVCWVVGALCLGPSAFDFARAFRMAMWPVADGQVTSSDTRMEEDGSRFRYYSDVNVRYKVGDTIYRTRSIRADSAMHSADRAWSDRIVTRYPRGQHVQVHYMAENPAESRVEIWPQPVFWVLTVWGLCAWFGARWMSGRDVAKRSGAPGGTAA